MGFTSSSAAPNTPKWVPKWATRRKLRPANRATFLSMLLCLLILPIIYTKFVRDRGDEAFLIDSHEKLLISPTSEHKPGVSASLTERPLYAKLTMNVGENPSAMYERAIESHAVHARRHNYRMEVLRSKKGITKGFWSKTYFIIQHLVAELSKDEDERLEWLMWFDADTIILNQNVPLDIFTPSTTDPVFEDVQFIFARDFWGMNTGVFFTRVHVRALELLIQAAAMPQWFPDLDFGRAYDQNALNRTLLEPGLNKHALWAPWSWFNTHEINRRDGMMCIHFYMDLYRMESMERYFTRLEEQDTTLQIPYNESFYPAEIESYWSYNRDLRSTWQAVDKAEVLYPYGNFTEVRARMDALMYLSDAWGMHMEEFMAVKRAVVETIDYVATMPPPEELIVNTTDQTTDNSTTSRTE